MENTNLIDESRTIVLRDNGRGYRFDNGILTYTPHNFNHEKPF